MADDEKKEDPVDELKDEFKDEHEINFDDMNGIKLKDTNMADYGGKEHRMLRQKTAKKEKAFKNAGTKKGLQIWRIENFRVKKWPKSRYGEFYSGDSYILLNTKVDRNGKKTYDVFFWLGCETTQDEAGTAAYKTVELDDLLGDLPIQHREVQGCESKKFQNLFPKMTILSGGVDSGFRHVKAKEYKPRLLHICGYRRHVKVYQVPLEHSSLNNSDSFVLDAGLKVYQFNGINASPWEKRKANAITDELEASRHGKVENSNEKIDGLADSGQVVDEFWACFGGKPDTILDEIEEKKVAEKHELSLHHVCDASGITEINEVCRGQKLDKNKLDSDDTFILDAGGMVFVWIGKGSTKNEKREAMQFAVRYLSDCGREKSVPIERVIEGTESQLFWDCFDGILVQKPKKRGKKKKKNTKKKKNVGSTVQNKKIENVKKKDIKKKKTKKKDK